jgi:hypothetical protein
MIRNKQDKFFLFTITFASVVIALNVIALIGKVIMAISSK